MNDPALAATDIYALGVAKIGQLARTISSRRVLTWTIIILVIAPPFVWTLAAIGGARSFARDIDVTYSICESSLAENSEMFDTAIAELPNDGPLADVAGAFRDAFTQESWAYSFPDLDETGDIILFRNGDVYGRTHPDGFEGLLTAERTIARFDSERFWVDACPSFRYPDAWPFNDGEDCVSTVTDDALVTTSWVVSDPGCSNDALRLSAVTENGELRKWTLSVRASATSPRTDTTYTVVEPPDVEWPSRFSIVPRWISNRMEASGP